MATRETLAQLADLWHVPAETFSASLVLAEEILGGGIAPVGVVGLIRETLSFEAGAAEEPLLTQQANRIAHRLTSAGVLVSGN